MHRKLYTPTNSFVNSAWTYQNHGYLTWNYRVGGDFVLSDLLHERYPRHSNLHAHGTLKFLLIQQTSTEKFAIHTPTGMAWDILLHTFGLTLNSLPAGFVSHGLITMGGLALDLYLQAFWPSFHMALQGGTPHTASNYQADLACYTWTTTAFPYWFETYSLVFFKYRFVFTI